MVSSPPPKGVSDAAIDAANAAADAEFNAAAAAAEYGADDDSDDDDDAAQSSLDNVIPVDKLKSGAAAAGRFFSWLGDSTAEAARSARDSFQASEIGQQASAAAAAVKKEAGELAADFSDGARALHNDIIKPTLHTALEAVAPAQRPKLTLYYFDIAGKGEPIRLACACSGIEFTDVRVTRAGFQLKKDNGELAFGQLPALRVEPRSAVDGTARQRFAGAFFTDWR